MARADVSIVVVSRGRSLELVRTLNGIAQLDYPSFELIVVACPAGCGAVSSREDALHIKLVPYDEPNISGARNRGIAEAAGEIIAFIDDDAVPEPSWLCHLIQPFEDANVAAAGGTVLGRNGISVQWTAAAITSKGDSVALQIDGQAPVILSPTQDRAIKTEGTNMAFRREVLAELGGFDALFRYFLDETDLNYRMRLTGFATAFVPLAVVHHGFAPSALRQQDRTPKDLTQIGTSKVVFLRKHCPKALQPIARKDFEQEQHDRLLRLMQKGCLTPDDVLKLMGSLRRGFAQGDAIKLISSGALPRSSRGFMRYPNQADKLRIVLSGWFWNRRKLHDNAVQARADGAVTTVFRFSPTALFHKVEFTEDGYWLQTGGIAGRSARSGPLIRFTTMASRTRGETARISAVRETKP